MLTSSGPLRVVVLISGTGTLLQALLDASTDERFGAVVVAVGSDRDGIPGLERAKRAGVPTFVHPLAGDRGGWDRALTVRVAGFEPDLVISAGFLKLVGPAFLASYGGRMINTHPALLPSFPGMHGPAEALAYGVKVSGATVFLVDAGVDTGVIIDQEPVRVADGDTAESLHERIKVVERDLLVRTVHRLATLDWRVEERRFRWLPAAGQPKPVKAGLSESHRKRSYRQV